MQSQALVRIVITKGWSVFSSACSVDTKKSIEQEQSFSKPSSSQSTAITFGKLQLSCKY